jgi:hypothetical protein
MGICNVGRAALRQQKADGRRVWTVERNQVGATLANQPGESGLPGWVTNGLGQRRGRNGDACAVTSRT